MPLGGQFPSNLPPGNAFIPGDFVPQPPPPPSNPSPPPIGHNNLGGSPGLVTSTGGLFGEFPVLLTPSYNTNARKNGIYVTDGTNFDTETDAYYYFPSPNIVNCAAKPVTISNVVLEYRELGIATFFIGVIVYIRKTDSFNFIEKKVQLKNISPKANQVNFPFPDGQIHTRVISLVIDGERPQLYIKRFANQGPLSIISATLVGEADVKQVMG